MDRERAILEVEKFIKHLKTIIPVDKAIIYGSVANGTAKEGSDVDLLVISKHFKGMNENEADDLLYNNKGDFPYDLHMYSVTPERFENASPLTILGDAKKGKMIEVK